MNKKEIILKTKKLTKIFPGTVALNAVDFELREEEIHALIGENGAGKSTFSKIISGAYVSTSGEIFIHGQKVNIKKSSDALKLGIGIVFQERDLVPWLTAVENIFLGRELLNSIFLRSGQMKEEIRTFMQEIGVEVPLEQPVIELGPSEQQMVEIFKVMLQKPRVMILDEPTSSLTEKETLSLFKLLKTLKKKVSIIFISHRLEEVFEISDRITVLRDGKKIDTVETAKTSPEEIIKMMVDREISNLYPKEEIRFGEDVLEVKNLSVGKLKQINFKARRGEIVGIAGIVGAGRTELLEAIFGLEKLEEGEIILNGEKVYPKSPGEMIKKGVYLIPENRRVAGLILQMNVAENLSIIHLSKVCSGCMINNQKEKILAKRLIDKFGIKVNNVAQNINNLSGGNQQKVVIGKWLAEKATLLLMDEATSGIDVGAKREIYRIMQGLAKEGTAIIYTSSDLPELIGISDRIYVLSEGRISPEIHRKNFSQQEIVKIATVTV